VNALVPALRARGVEAIVVLIHEGGASTGDYNECPGISGPISPATPIGPMFARSIAGS